MAGRYRNPKAEKEARLAKLDIDTYIEGEDLPMGCNPVASPTTYAKPGYRPEYAGIARRLCLMGATNQELGLFFGCTKRMIDYWICEGSVSSEPEFRAAVLAGRMDADARVASSIFKKAIGYSRPVKKYNKETDRMEETGEIRHFEPDTVACIFWLKNRRGWRDQSNVVISSPDGIDVTHTHEFDLSSIPTDQLESVTKILSAVVNSIGEGEEIKESNQ